MRTVHAVLAGAAAAALAAHAVLAEDLSTGRKQIGRGTSARVAFDRSNLTAGQPTFDPTGKGPLVTDPRTGAQSPSDLTAAQVARLAATLQRIRDLNKLGFRSNAQLLAGDPSHVPPIAGLTQAQIDIMNVFRVPSSMSYTKAASGIILPNVHQTVYYAFDIDRILNNEFTVIHNGLLGEPDVLIPVKPVKYERIVSTSQDTGLTGGWTVNGQAGTAPHYRVPIPQYAVKSDGNLALDTHHNPPTVVPLQLLGAGNWFDTRPENLPPEYTYDPTTEKFRVAMSINESSPNVFPGGGHIACYWIYDFGNPPNCHAVARSGDPTAIGAGLGGYDSPNQGYGAYGTTTVVAINNSGADN